MSKKKLGLLVMAYGTPYKEEDILPYYTHIRGGREPSQEALQELTDAYAALGGVSPLAKITEDQTYSLEKRLNEIQDEYEFKAYIGLKHIHPFIEDTVEEMAKDGITEAVSIVLAPHYSTMSIKSYNDRAHEEAEKYGLKITSVEDWYKEPKFVSYWANAIKDVYKQMAEDEKEKAVLIVSAHSLPEKILKADDPYPKQLEETAELISEAAGVENYVVAWQSEGNTPDPWLGPDVLDITPELYHEKGYRSFVYAPVGFVADHLETMYDNDIECKEVCDELGANYYRPEMPNAKPEFIDAMATVVLKKLQSDA